MNFFRQFLLVFGLFFFVNSCSEITAFFSETKIIDDNWAYNKSIDFNFEIKDTSSVYDIFFVLRNNNSYPYRNINFFTHLKNNFQTLAIDTLEYNLANQKGEWLGRGLGEKKENLLVYKENYQFIYPGSYKLMVNQAMRNQKLIGIEDFSIIIEKK